MYLESDAGLGKSMLVSAISEQPGIARNRTTSMKALTGEVFSVEGRDLHVVKIQVCFCGCDGQRERLIDN